jgi:putative N-acetylmannosamine-6-phosphate epimerase
VIKLHPTVKAPGDSEAPVYDYASLEFDEFKELAESAMVIIALDTTSEARSVAYVAEALRANPDQNYAVLHVALDFRGTVVRHLVAAIEAAKGSDLWSTLTNGPPNPARATQ